MKNNTMNSHIDKTVLNKCYSEFAIYLRKIIKTNTYL